MAPLAAVIPYVMAASAAVGAVGAVSSAQAQSASYKSQQEAANYNAEANRQNAISAEAAASANELAQRRQNTQELGTLRARMAEGGGLNGGTGTGVLAQSGANLELSALNTRYQGTMQARGLLNAATLDQYQATVAGQNANRSTTAGYLGAAGQALGTTANYYNARSFYGSGGMY